MPRTKSGRPDFSGNYDISNLTPWSRPKEFGDQRFLNDEQIAAIAERQAGFVANDNRQLDPDRGAPDKAADPGAYNFFWLDFGTDALPIDGKVRTSVIIDPPNGQMPAMTDAGKARQGQIAQYDYWGKPKDVAWWMETGDGPYNNLKTIVQTEDHVVINIEWMHHARVIRLAKEGKKPEHLGDWYNIYGGDSVGWWEEDTLVVETTNIRDWPGSPRPGVYVVERFAPVEDKGLVYRFTVTDPDYTAPYTGELMWPRTDTFNYEFACHEGNYSMGGMLRGARVLEQDWLEANGGAEE